MDRNTALHHFARMYEEDPEDIITLIVQVRFIRYLVHFCVRNDRIPPYFASGRLCYGAKRAIMVKTDVIRTICAILLWMADQKPKLTMRNLCLFWCALRLQKGGNVNSVNSQGDTPLHIACAEKHVAIVKSLLAHGANPNAQNDHGETPLHVGARLGPDVVVKVLLKYGASPTITGVHGTPFDVAASATSKRLLAPPPSATPQPTMPSSSVSTPKSYPSTNSAPGEATHSSGSMSGVIYSTSDPHLGNTDHTASSAALQRMASKKYHWLVEFNEIVLGPQIGSGGFGVVYRGVWRGIDVAVKCLKPEAEVTEESLSVFMHEVNVMSKLRHQNILLFVGACLTQPHICFLTEFIPHGNLRQVLDKERLQPIKKLNMSLEATRGLTYLHAQTPSVLHRDLKTTNVLVDDNYHIKLADFGLSRPMPHHTQSQSASLKQLPSVLLSDSSSTVPSEASSSDPSAGHTHHNGKHQNQTSSTSPSTSDTSTTPTYTTNATNEATSSGAPSSNVKEEAKTSSDASVAEEPINLTSTTNGATQTSDCQNANPSSAPSANNTLPLGPSYLDAIEQAGTLYSTPPEVLNGLEYTKESDVYALGIIFWELATEKMPFEGLNNLQMLRTIIDESLPVPTEMGPLYGELVRDMLAKDPSTRPTLPQIAERLKAVRIQLGEQR